MKSKNALNKVIETLQESNDITPGKRKTANKKGEQNTLTEGSVRKLQVGDGTVDILAKIYILMKKQYDDEKKNAELQRDFEAEKERESRKEEREGGRGEGKSKAYKVKGAGDFGLMDLLKGLLAAAGLAWLFGKGGKNPLAEFAKDVVKNIAKWAGGLVVEALKDLSTFVRDGWNDLLAKLNLNLPKITPGNLALPGTGMVKSGAAGARAGANLTSKLAPKPTSEVAAKIPTKGPDRLSSLVGSVSTKEKRALEAKGYKVNKESGRLTREGKFVGLSETEEAIGRAAPALQGAATASKMTPAMLEMADRMRSCAKFLRKVGSVLEKIPGVKWASKKVALISLCFNTSDMIMDDMQAFFAGQMSAEMFKKRATQAFAYAISTLLASEAGAYIGGMIGAFIGSLPAATGIGAALAVVTAPVLGLTGAIAGGVYGPQLLAKIGGQEKIASLVGDYMFGKDDEILGKTPQSQNKPMGSDTNDSTFNSLTAEQQDAFLKEQGKQEGFGADPKNIPTRHNNPGNITWTEQNSARWEKFGGTKGDVVKGSDGKTRTFVKFPSAQQGYAAQKDLWSKNYGDMPLDSALQRWVDPDNPAAFSAYKSKVYSTIGNTETKVSSVTEAPKVPEIKPTQASNQPIIVNAPTNNSVTNNNGGGGAGGMVEARARNDDPALLKSQYGFVRTV